jgi:hypothetical protein
MELTSSSPVEETETKRGEGGKSEIESGTRMTKREINRKRGG